MSAASKSSVLPALLAAATLALGAAVAPPAAAGARFATSDPQAAERGETYREGQRALEEQRWDAAARAFAAAAAADGPDVDSALYWKAYADWKGKRRKEALDAIRTLLDGHPRSTWADDARALELEIRGGAGGDPAAVADDELKLYALDALMQVEPARALPVLERILAGDDSLKLKQRALFVLSQSEDPRAREILVGVARAGEPAELRREAVRTLGIAGEAEDLAALAALARDGQTPSEVREAVVEAYLIADRAPELAQLARQDADPAVRRKAIEALGALEALPALRELWASERDPEVRRKLLEAFAIAEDVDTLARVAREAGAPELRAKAIEGLAIADTPEASRQLRALYGELADPELKHKVLEAFMIQDDAATLIELFRAERDPALKREIVQLLSVMDDPQASELLMSILGEKP
jgi:HEAT repeat protein